VIPAETVIFASTSNAASFEGAKRHVVARFVAPSHGIVRLEAVCLPPSRDVSHHIEDGPCERPAMILAEAVVVVPPTLSSRGMSSFDAVLSENVCGIREEFIVTYVYIFVSNYS
jgi:hypothetical protein